MMAAAFAGKETGFGTQRAEHTSSYGATGTCPRFRPYPEAFTKMR